MREEPFSCGWADSFVLNDFNTYSRPLFIVVLIDKNADFRNKSKQKIIVNKNGEKKLPVLLKSVFLDESKFLND